MNELEKIGEVSSENERTAEAAEREIQSILLCNYAKKFIGRKFTASYRINCEFWNVCVL